MLPTNDKTNIFISNMKLVFRIKISDRGFKRIKLVVNGLFYQIIVGLQLWKVI